MKLTRLLVRAVALGRRAGPGPNAIAAAELQRHLEERDRLRARLEAIAAGTYVPTPEEQAAIEKRSRAPETAEWRRARAILEKMARPNPEGGAP